MNEDSQVVMSEGRLDAITSQSVFEHSAVTRQKVTEIFSRDEIRQLTQRSDLMGAWAVFGVWAAIGLIFAFMALASHWPLWASIPAMVLATALLGGRQLALAIIVHEASHGTLFKTRWLNTTLTDWLCARPVWNNLPKYRAYHFVHHTKTASSEDPDLILRNGYPTTKRSLMRKFTRDLTGVVGVKALAGKFLMDLGILKWTVNGEVHRIDTHDKNVFYYITHYFREATPMLLMNVLLVIALSSAGYAWLYLFWVLAYITFFMLFIRIRSMAEHAVCELSEDMFKNTRTMKADWISRALVAPIRVNYHMEHHIIASCPYFHLKKAHQILRERNAVPEPPTYWQMIKLMGSGAA